MAGDPVIHGVAADHPYLRHLLANLLLQYGIDIRQEKKFAVAVRFWNLRLEPLENIQIRSQRVGFIEILEILSRPMETLACCPLNSLDVDAASLKYRFLLRRKILADDADDTNLGKKTGGQREVRGCSAQAAVHCSVRCTDAVKCN